MTKQRCGRPTILIDIGPGAGKRRRPDHRHGLTQASRREQEQPDRPIPERQTQLCEFPLTARCRQRSKWLTLKDVTTHNLKNVTAQVSAGLPDRCQRRFGQRQEFADQRHALSRAGKEARAGRPRQRDIRQDLLGAEQIDKLIPIDQAPDWTQSAQLPGDLRRRAGRSPQSLRGHA